MIAAALTADGPAVERPSKPALGGPGRLGRRRMTRSGRRPFIDRAIVHCLSGGMTPSEIATALRITERAVRKARGRIRALAVAESPDS
jgi:DNA-binding CsgD family transcriptional regulator